MFCLTPNKDTGMLNRHQKKYNKIHSSTRICVEHTFGILKQRIHQLYHIKLRGLPRICHLIRACCVLHNMCSELDLEFLEDAETCQDINLDTEGDENQGYQGTQAAKAKRKAISILLNNEG